MSMSMSLSYNDDNQQESVSPESSLLPLCRELQLTSLESNINIETFQDSISFKVVENVLERGMRETFPFCGWPSERTPRRLNLDEKSNFYVGHVELDEDADQGKTCCLELKVSVFLIFATT